MATRVIKPAYEDPHNSVDVFDKDRVNDFGDMYCVAPAVLPEQANEEWGRYLKETEDVVLQKRFEAAMIAIMEEFDIDRDIYNDGSDGPMLTLKGFVADGKADVQECWVDGYHGGYYINPLATVNVREGFFKLCLEEIDDYISMRRENIEGQMAYPNSVTENCLSCRRFLKHPPPT
jgi:hypothetical protein